MASTAPNWKPRHPRATGRKAGTIYKCRVNKRTRSAFARRPPHRPSGRALVKGKRPQQTGTSTTAAAGTPAVERCRHPGGASRFRRLDRGRSPCCACASRRKTAASCARPQFAGRRAAGPQDCHASAAGRKQRCVQADGISTASAVFESIRHLDRRNPPDVPSNAAPEAAIANAFSICVRLSLHALIRSHHGAGQ